MLIQVAVCAVMAASLLAMPSGLPGRVAAPTDRHAGAVYVDPFQQAGVRPIGYAPPR